MNIPNNGTIPKSNSSIFNDPHELIIILTTLFSPLHQINWCFYRKASKNRNRWIAKRSVDSDRIRQNQLFGCPSQSSYTREHGNAVPVTTSTLTSVVTRHSETRCSTIEKNNLLVDKLRVTMEKWPDLFAYQCRPNRLISISH